MTLTTLKNRLTQTAARYSRDTSGQFGIMFAASIMMLIGGLATAIDLSSAYAAKQRLQDTTDQISLYAARQQITDAGELTLAAQDYMDLNYPGSKGSRIKINSVTRTGDTVTVDATNTIDTDFAHMIGYKTLDVRANSSATFAEKSIDIAMVLDSTGSMAGSKMKSLKTSASNLIDTLDDYDTAQVRVAVVPFSNYVNVGLSRRNAKWLSVPKDGVVTLPEKCEKRRDVISKTNCRKVKSTCTNDGVTSTCYKTKCDIKRGPEYEVCFKPTYTAKWHGCVGSRKEPLNEQAAYKGKKIPGLMGNICGTEMRPLTTNLKKAKATIKALDAKGNTYMPSGLAWGWRTLNADVPLTEAAKGKAKDVEKVMILMTDGDNTKSKGGDWHEVNNGVQANAATARLCENAKNDKITIYTIAYDISDADTRSLVKSCASAPAMYFDAKNASDLDKAFKEIGDSLSTLRLTN
ncbi:VWA domain-containing protein [Fretibacter rubidus]|uniref:VWA domain-containing protein n=1 Tax=Fretibacter rubidus TaxID=570162 RepID=UPI00352A4BCB